MSRGVAWSPGNGLCYAMTDDAPDRRFFSYHSANRTLPLVRRIVEDILEQYRELAPLLVAGQRGGPAVRERTRALEALVGELHDLGCHFKGFDEGLVDWYSLYAGRPVFLCWRSGEAEIEWWHQIDAGFAGRQPILPEQRDAFRGE